MNAMGVTVRMSKPRKIGLAAQVQALERRQFAPAVPGGKRSEEMEGQDVALVVDGTEILRLQQHWSSL